jgi:hypothetical protein
MHDPGAGDDITGERRGRADRRHHREYVVLRAVVVFNDDPPISCGLMDISVGGARLKLDDTPPADGARALLYVEQLKFRGKAKVIRTYYTPTGTEVALQFEEQQHGMPGKLLEYKLKSHSLSGGRRR